MNNMPPVKTNLKYPSRFEIDQALKSKFCSRTFVEKLAQSKGIFINRATQDDLARYLAGFFFENKDIETIRDRAYRRSAIKSLSGFVISSQSEEFEPIDALEELRGSNDMAKGIELSAITKEILEDGTVQFRGEMEYVDVKPGRTEFLQEEHRHLEYVIKPLDESSYQILVESDNSNDAKVFGDFVRKNAGKEVRLEVLDSEQMSSKDTIQFFDDLGKFGMQDDWKIIDIKHLVLRKGNEEIEQTGKEILSGITQAVLDGNNLRENSFVKQSEESGYRFSAMTYEYENIKQGYVIEVKAEFKLRPKVFEVGVNNYRKRIGTEEKLEKADLDSKDEIEIKTQMWLKAKEIYKNLVSNETVSEE